MKNILSILILAAMCITPRAANVPLVLRTNGTLVVPDVIEPNSFKTNFHIPLLIVSTLTATNPIFIGGDGSNVWVYIPTATTTNAGLFSTALYAMLMATTNPATATNAGQFTTNLFALLSTALQSETDPMFFESPAASLAWDNFTNWNTAFYTWGDHRTNNYATTNWVYALVNDNFGWSITPSNAALWMAGYTHSLEQGNPHNTVITNISGLRSELDGKQPLLPDGVTIGYVLTWNGSAWGPAAPGGGGTGAAFTVTYPLQLSTGAVVSLPAAGTNADGYASSNLVKQSGTAYGWGNHAGLYAPIGEVSTRAAADLELTNNLAAESLTRSNADNTLTNLVTAEAAARTNTATALTNLLTAQLLAEASARSNTDNALTNLIGAELSARTNADAGLTNLISSEATTRGNTDTALTNALAAETLARATAGTNATNQLASEVLARGNADAALSNNLTLYLPLAGGTMSGALTLSGLPTNVNHAANKQYVDAETTARASADSALSAGISVASNYVAKGTGTGITNSAIYESGGNVGIGTTNPTSINASAKLAVSGPGAQLIVIKPTDTNTSSTASFAAYSDVGNFQFLSHGSARTTSRYGLTLGGWDEIYSSAGNTGVVIGIAGDKPIVFANNNFERMRIDAGGNVGIGKTPSYPLDVAGTAAATSFYLSEFGTNKQYSDIWCDLSSAAGGYGLFGGNSYLNASDNTFRYSQTHSSLGAVGIATHYPSWNSLSVVSSGTTTSLINSAYTPIVLANFAQNAFTSYVPVAATNFVQSGYNVWDFRFASGTNATNWMPGNKTFATNEITGLPAWQTNVISLLAAEQAARSNVDWSISNYYATVSQLNYASNLLYGLINSEASARSAADNNLSSAISAEAGTRSAADGVLTGQINSEAVARIAADATKAATNATWPGTSITSAVATATTALGGWPTKWSFGDVTNASGTLTYALSQKSDTSHAHAGLYEQVLGNPSANGQILASTTTGTRSWVNNAMPTFAAYVIPAANASGSLVNSTLYYNGAGTYSTYDHVVVGNLGTSKAGGYDGSIDAAGTIRGSNYLSSDSTPGATGDATGTDVLHFKNGLYTGKN